MSDKRMSARAAACCDTMRCRDCDDAASRVSSHRLSASGDQDSFRNLVLTMSKSGCVDNVAWHTNWPTTSDARPAGDDTTKHGNIDAKATSNLPEQSHSTVNNVTESNVTRRRSDGERTLSGWVHTLALGLRRKSSLLIMMADATCVPPQDEQPVVDCYPSHLKHPPLPRLCEMWRIVGIALCPLLLFALPLILMLMY